LTSIIIMAAYTSYSQSSSDGDSVLRRSEQTRIRWIQEEARQEGLYQEFSELASVLRKDTLDVYAPGWHKYSSLPEMYAWNLVQSGLTLVRIVKLQSYGINIFKQIINNLEYEMVILNPLVVDAVALEPTYEDEEWQDRYNSTTPFKVLRILRGTLPTNDRRIIVRQQHFEAYMNPPPPHSPFIGTVVEKGERYILCLSHKSYIKSTLEAYQAARQKDTSVSIDTTRRKNFYACGQFIPVALFTEPMSVEQRQFPKKVQTVCKFINKVLAQPAKTVKSKK
jgi:hypothetical protein